MAVFDGRLEDPADSPSSEVAAAGRIVLELTKERGILLLANVLPENTEEQVNRGVMTGPGRRDSLTEAGREYGGREIPW